MAVTQLAADTDVESVLGRDLTSAEDARIGAILDKASELFRRASGQHFTAATSTVRLKVNRRMVHLTQYPVTAVTAVVDDDGDAVEYEQRGQWLEVLMYGHEFATVTYSHGGDVPDLVRLAVAEVAARALMIDDNARGGKSQASETTGPFTESATYAAWAVGGQVTLSPEDKALARSYRTVTPSSIVTSTASPATFLANKWESLS